MIGDMRIRGQPMQGSLRVKDSKNKLYFQTKQSELTIHFVSFIHMIAKMLLAILLVCFVHGRWTEQQAAQWYNQYTWSAGFNYAPSYAVNEIEMWESFSSSTVDRELQWAHELGFSKLRVFLHVAPYKEHAAKFLSTITNFLEIARKNQMHVIPVLFDDCWNSEYEIGPQPDPIPGVHNSRWVQCPGNTPVEMSVLEGYVTDILTAFKDSPTVVMWDLYNEVGNSGHWGKSLPLLKKIFEWARKVNPSQPLTSGHWNGDILMQEVNEFILSQSDVITFHAYCDKACTLRAIQNMQSHKRPVICTEYMARPTGSRFITHLPLFKEKNVWAINWGFVFGRTQTYYPWGSKEGSPVPEVWFHDVVHKNGTPFDVAETDFIRNITRI